jgi:hypothetical protein
MRLYKKTFQLPEKNKKYSVRVETHICVSRVQINHAIQPCNSTLQFGSVNSECPAGDANMRLYMKEITPLLPRSSRSKAHPPV